jgi:hypothetical protein
LPALRRRRRPWAALFQGLVALGLAALLAQLIVEAAEQHQRRGQVQLAADGRAMLWAPAVLALAGVAFTAQAVGLALAGPGQPRRRLRQAQVARPAPTPAPPVQAALSDPDRRACAALGVAPGSSWAEIRAVWRRQLPHWHPDRGGDLELWHQRQSAYRLQAELRR